METRDKILETAFLLYLDKGFTNVSMNDLLKEAGITKGGFYYYFESKDVLLAEVMNKYLFSYYDEIIAYINHYKGSPGEKLRMLFFSIPGLYSDSVKVDNQHRNNKVIDYRSFYLLLMDGVHKYGVIRNYYEEFHVKLLKIIRQIMEECKEKEIIPGDADLDEMSRFILACVEGTIVLSVVVPDIPLEETMTSNYNYACKCLGIE